MIDAETRNNLLMAQYDWGSKSGKAEEYAFHLFSNLLNQNLKRRSCFSRWTYKTYSPINGWDAKIMSYIVCFLAEIPNVFKDDRVIGGTWLLAFFQEFIDTVSVL